MASPLDTDLQTLPGPCQDWLHTMLQDATCVRFLGARATTTLSLTDTFVPLAVAADRRPGVGRRDALDPAGAEDSIVPIEEAVRRAEVPPRVGLPRVGLVVIGEPGSGKSTLLRQLYGRIATEGAPAVGFRQPLVPLLLRCDAIPEAWWNQAAPHNSHGLADLIEHVATAAGHPGAGRAALDLAPQPRFVFLLDALDEVREQVNRARLSTWLSTQIRRAPWQDSRFVVTCREAAWTKLQALDRRFLPVHVQGLGRSAIAEYVEKYFVAFDADEGRDSDLDQHAARTRARTLVARLDDLPASNRLTQNPSHLAQLCLVCRDSASELPGTRSELYERCLGTLVGLPPELGVSGLPAAPTLRALEPLAWFMHVLPDVEAEAVSTTAMTDLIADGVAADPALTAVGPAATLARLRDHCRVLDGGDRDHRFAHQSFQEYLAAQFARAQSAAHDRAAREPLVYALAAVAYEAHWKLVILLAVEAGLFAPFVAALAELDPSAPRPGDLRTLLQDCVAVARPLDEPAVLAVFERLWDGDARRHEFAKALWNALGVDLPSSVIERARARGSMPEIRATLDTTLGPIRIASTAVVGPVVSGVTPGRDFVDPTLGAAFLWLPGGEFWMGSSKQVGHPAFDEDAYDDELEARRVSVAQDPRTTATTPPGFWVAEYPVTHGDYARYLDAQRRAGTVVEEPAMWRDPRFTAERQPVVGVSWDDAQSFCTWLTQTIAPPPGLAFRLPTEAEWEYAARGPTTFTEKPARYPWGDAAPTPDHADYDQDWEKGKPAPVGAHRLGQSRFSRAQDLAGGVWEWCVDHWSAAYPPAKGIVIDPCRLDAADPRGASRVVRGGSWSGGAGYLRSAFRYRLPPRAGPRYVGFRVVCGGSRQHIAP